MAQADFISIHAPPRGATNTISRLSRHRHFNSRPSARGDTDSARVTGKALVFQFTPLREGRPQNEICLRPVTGFQFTPLREGRPLHATLIGTNRFISIHAPPRGATSAIIGINPPLYDFNSRPSARGDGAVSKTYVDEQISIHAPPRGATVSSGVTVILVTLFQFTPLREGRQEESDGNASNPRFQFTPLREGRRIVKNNNLKIPKFQFTPLREGRLRIAITPFFAVYFNSRPSARGDLQRRNRHARIAISIHAPPRGATSDAINDIKAERISIHAPPRGATGIRMAQQAMQKFQFTPLREGRLCPCGASYFFIVDFNSRPSARGD